MLRPLTNGEQLSMLLDNTRRGVNMLMQLRQHNDKRPIKRDGIKRRKRRNQRRDNVNETVEHESPGQRVDKCNGNIDKRRHGLPLRRRRPPRELLVRRRLDLVLQPPPSSSPAPISSRFYLPIIGLLVVG